MPNFPTITTILNVFRPRELGSDIELFPTRTPTLPPATHTNSYALGGRDVLIVEPSPQDDVERRAMIAWVGGMRSAGRNPIAVLATHHHADHVGAAMSLRSELDLPLWAHPATQERLQDVAFDRSLHDGERIRLDGPIARTWEVLHTPGHAPGHVCLHEPDAGALVLGDMIASQGTILIAPGDGDMGVYLEQLRRLADLDARLGLPAHGEPIERPSRVLRATHDHRLMREGKVVDALARCGPCDVDTLLPDVYDDTPVALWPLAKMSLMAHLSKLADEGVVEQDIDGRHRLGARRDG